ncbi:MAG: hypothetical protein R3E83_21705 [Burkholderiaceae bacterium]
MRFSGTPVSIAMRRPLGQHTDEVLNRSSGLDAEAIAAMRRPDV